MDSVKTAPDQSSARVQFLQLRGAMWRRAMRVAALGVLARSTHAWPLAGRQQCATRALSLAGNGLRLRGGATEVVWRRLAQDAATAPGPAPIARSSDDDDRIRDGRRRLPPRVGVVDARDDAHARR